MKKVGIADLKARLSEHLRAVRAGRTLVVCDRDVPVALLSPHAPDRSLEIRAATRKPSELTLPPPPPTETDGVAVLLGDRATR
jgi:antitoxin (DNA-binding transcriptional repressor) of toxin-antitoxin stability system